MREYLFRSGKPPVHARAHFNLYKTMSFTYFNSN